MITPNEIKRRLHFAMVCNYNPGVYAIKLVSFWEIHNLNSFLNSLNKVIFARMCMNA